MPKLLALIAKLPGRVIAEPELVVTPDKSAFIHLGGEISYHEKDSKGKDTLKFMDYGTHVDLTAHRLSNDRIRLNFSISESVPDNANTVGGKPAMTCRTASMELDVRPGETIVQGGTVDRITRTKARFFDFLGLPRQTETEYFQTFLLVTAHIVPPSKAKPADNAKPLAR
jgi:Flp pilus assembly secretin CpaC